MSSVAVGRSCIDGTASDPPSPGRGPAAARAPGASGAPGSMRARRSHSFSGDSPAECCELDGTDETLEVGERLHLADHAPFQGAEHLPEGEVLGRDDPAAGCRVGGEQLLGRPESSGALLDVAEAPRLHAEPAEILDRVAEVRELPVEHGAHALRADDEVAVAEIAVHEGEVGVGQVHRAFGEPPQAQLERGVWLAEHVEDAAELLDLRRRILTGEAGEGGQRDRVDRRRDLGALLGHPGSCDRVFVVAQQLARDRLAVDTRHDEPGAEVVLVVEEEPDLGDRDAARGGGAEELVLGGSIGAAGVRAGSRRSTSGRTVPSAATVSNDQVSREAPPERRRSARISTASPRCRAQASARRSASTAGMPGT